MLKLDMAAQDALVNTEARQGATVAKCSTEAMHELLDAGLMGMNGGLTRKGLIMRARIMSQRLDEAF